MNLAEAAPQVPRVLIVEDDRIVALDLAGTLQELGYGIAGMATRGEEAIEQAKRLNPQLILMDVRLGGTLDGIQATQTIREDSDVPVIYLTAHSDSETLRRATNTSASGYLVKPFKSPELRCAIEIALHKHAIDARLRENEQWLRITMQSLAEAVIATDERGRIRLFNRIAEKLTGWASAEATDISIDEILAVVDERTGTPMESLVRKAVELREALSVAEGTSIVSRSGKTVAVEESASPIVDARGNVLGGVLVLRDVSERRHQLLEIQKLNSELERRVLERTAALEAANRELESFSYSVAHDLRAPLRGIDGFSELLLVECGKQLDPHAVGYVNRVRKAAARMSELIDALLSLAHIGRTNLDARDLDFTQLVDGIAQELAAADPERCVGIRIEPGMRVRADPKLLRLAIGNLLDNAWKFTGRRAEACIDVGARRDVTPHIYFVRDNGAGFDPTHAERLFGAFQRLHSEAEFPGTGIGLAIVQRVIERHGGSIWAESSPGQGATFYFTLPSR